MKTRMISMILAAAMLLSLGAPVFAEEEMLSADALCEAEPADIIPEDETEAVQTDDAGTQAAEVPQAEDSTGGELPDGDHITVETGSAVEEESAAFDEEADLPAEVDSSAGEDTITGSNGVTEPADTKAGYETEAVSVDALVVEPPAEDADPQEADEDEEETSEDPETVSKYSEILTFVPVLLGGDSDNEELLNNYVSSFFYDSKRTS